MRALTLGFYVLIGALLAWFAANNWTMVTLWLWGGYELAIRLPVLLLLMFLIGAFPLVLLQTVNRWRWQRRVTKLERELAERPAAPAATTAPNIDAPYPGL
jgi:uncharacterized integral membrane protein